MKWWNSPYLFLIIAIILCLLAYLVVSPPFQQKTSEKYSESMENYLYHESFQNEGDDYPLEIDLANFDDVENTKLTKSNVVVILVYDDNCPHCQNFKSTWNSLIETYNRKVVNDKTFYFFQAGNKNANVRYQIEKKYDIKGYPTILISQNNQPFYEYDNLRDFAVISSYLKTL